jgi:acyl-CoA synthetase (NDP forming)
MKKIANEAHATDHSSKVYQNLFSPETIVVIGASNDPLKPGGRVIKNIKENGYSGSLWAVNPKTESILGLPTYKSIGELPKAPDLAIVAIPSKFVLPAVRELAGCNTGATIVLTSGFGEKDEEGKQAEQEMRRIADDAGMALIGPNCSGFLTNTYKGKFAGIIPQLPGGAVDFISGSGATVDYVMERASSRGLSFGTVINLGNSVQMGVEDLLELHDQNYGPESAPVLMLYMESVKKPAKLLRHAQSLVDKGCAIVGIKSGATAAGERAAASHTGAMATSDTAVQALFDKAGIIRVHGRGELINVACVLTAVGGSLKGKRACILTDAGGPGVMLSDELARQGMETPLLTDQTVAELEKILPPEASTLNPIDMLPSRTSDQTREILRVLREYERDHIDVIVFLTGDSGLSDNADIYREISGAMKQASIPVIPMFSSVITSRPKIAEFINRGNIFFPDEVELGKAIGKVAHWESPEETSSALKGYDRDAIGKALGNQSGALDPDVVRQVLDSAGFTLPAQIEVFNQEQLAEGCQRAGYPLAMKVIGPLHKTDVGGVKLGIANEEEALAAWKALLAIPDAKGVLLQPMIGGQEVILGASREGDFGHLVMFGLGGIYTEVLKDVKFSLAPVSQKASMRMIQGIQGFPLLKGVRGESGMDIEVLADNVQRLGRLVADFPQIKEIDLNPIKGTGENLFAVDARIISEPS